MPGKLLKKLFTPSRIVFYILAIGVIYFAAHHLDKLIEIKSLLFKISPAWLLLAVGLQGLTYVLNALIMRVLLGSQTPGTGLFTLFKISVVIMFVNQALPTGGISGNGYIFNQLVKRGVPAQHAFTVLVLASVCYYIAFLLLLGSFYAWYYHSVPGSPSAISYTVATGFLFFIGLGAIMLVISDKRTITLVLHKLRRFSWIKRYMMKINPLQLQASPEGNPSFSLMGNQKAALMGVLLQVGILTCDALTIYALTKGFNLALPFGRIVFAMMLTLVVGSLPISPGSLIAYESGMTYFFTLMGLPVSAALVITLLFRFLTFWLPIPAGLFLYRNLQRHSS